MRDGSWHHIRINAKVARKLTLDETEPPALTASVADLCICGCTPSAPASPGSNSPTAILPSEGQEEKQSNERGQRSDDQIHINRQHSREREGRPFVAESAQHTKPQLHALAKQENPMDEEMHNSRRSEWRGKRHLYSIQVGNTSLPGCVTTIPTSISDDDDGGFSHAPLNMTVHCTNAGLTKIPYPLPLSTRYL